MNGQTFTLRSADGTEFSVHAASAQRNDAPGVIVLPDIRGLHPYYIDLVERLAGQGIHAIAIDYFGRTAGIGIRDDGFDWQSHIPQTKATSIVADVAAAIAYVRSEAGGATSPMYTLGFCFGGGHSFALAAAGLNLAGVVGFYGRPVGPTRDGSPAPIDLVSKMTCPVLGLFGGADQGIPRSAVDAFDSALKQADVPHTLHVYPGAPHSFFDRRARDYAEACNDAWKRLLRFIKEDQL
ncbi:MAG: dienelactone hydrolase family protein [Chloroflexi bacterium]|nr:dienelactone hydrolase family protein [Chloroflexota bacterium]